MSKRSFLRKSAISLTATLGLGGTLAHAADVTLNGNTLQIGTRTIVRSNALRGAYYHFGSGIAGNPPQVAFDTTTGIRALEEAEKTAGNPNQEADLIVDLNFDQANGNPFGPISGDTVDFGTNDQIMAVWSGELVVDPSAAGV